MLTLARGAISARGFCNPLVSASSPTAPPPPHCTRPGHSAGERAAPQCVAGDTNKPRWRQLSSNCWDPTLRRVPTPANSVLLTSNFDITPALYSHEGLERVNCFCGRALAQAIPSRTSVARVAQQGCAPRARPLQQQCYAVRQRPLPED